MVALLHHYLILTQVYTNNLDANSIADYVKSVMKTRLQHLQPDHSLEYAVNETVQVRGRWWKVGSGH